MHCHLLAAALLATVTFVPAQESLATTFLYDNGGAPGGAVYFTLTADHTDLTITDIDFNLLTGTTGSIDVYTVPTTHVGNELDPSVWTKVATCPVTASLPGSRVNGVLSVPLTIAAGSSVGIAYVDRTAGTSHAYTVGSSQLPRSYTGCGLTLDSGSASNLPFAGVVTSGIVVNTAINYGVAGSCAAIEMVGEGCAGPMASVYQATTLDAFAASNSMSGLDFTSTGGGYLVTRAVGAIRPAGSLDPNAVPQANVGDDVVVPVGTLGLEFGSNGWIASGSGNTILWAPTPAVFLNNPSPQWSVWSDFAPNLGGTVTYEEAGSRARLTFDGVVASGTSDRNTFQFDIDTATGDVSIYFGAMASAIAHPLFVGYSPGGANADPGPVRLESELARSGVIVLDAVDSLPLALRATSRPVLGTNWDLEVREIPLSSAFGATIWGLSDPNVLDLASLGMPGCQLRASLDLIDGPWSPSGSARAYRFAIPAMPPALIGIELFTQVAVFANPGVNNFGTITSNAVKGTLGDA